MEERKKNESVGLVWWLLTRLAPGKIRRPHMQKMKRPYSLGCVGGKKGVDKKKKKKKNKSETLPPRTRQHTGGTLSKRKNLKVLFLISIPRTASSQKTRRRGFSLVKGEPPLLLIR